MKIDIDRFDQSVMNELYGYEEEIEQGLRSVVKRAGRFVQEKPFFCASCAPLRLSEREIMRKAGRSVFQRNQNRRKRLCITGKNRI